jgi:hypothetical protein
LFVYFGVALLSTMLSGAGRAVRGSAVGRPAVLSRLGHRLAGSNDARHRRWNAFDVAIVVVLVSFSALRYNVGTDFQIYALNFAQIQPEYWQYYLARSPLEGGYTVLSIAVRAISADPFAIFWVSSALTVIPAYVGIKKLSRDPTLSIFLFITLAFYVAPFNAIRQGIAVSLVFWASTFIGRKTWLFICVSLLATTFHLTALFAAVILLAARRWRPTTAQAVGALIAACGLAVVIRFGSVKALIDSVVPQYGQYAEANAAGVGSYLVLAVKLVLLFVVLHLLVRSDETGGSTDDARHAGYVAIGLAFLVIGTQYLVISRMEMYFGIFLIVLIPNAIARQDVSPASRTLKRAAVVIVAIVFFAAYLGNYGELLPYRISLSQTW